MVNMKKSLFEEMGGTYRQEGDYFLPNLSVPELPPLGVWGQRHLRYIKEHRPARYNALLLGGNLNGYLADIDEQAQEQLDTIIRQMAAAQGVTEELKTADQMAWVGMMNAIRSEAVEIVNTELIYL